MHAGAREEQTDAAHGSRPSHIIRLVLTHVVYSVKHLKSALAVAYCQAALTLFDRLRDAVAHGINNASGQRLCQQRVGSKSTIVPANEVAHEYFWFVYQPDESFIFLLLKIINTRNILDVIFRNQSAVLP